MTALAVTRDRPANAQTASSATAAPPAKAATRRAPPVRRRIALIAVGAAFLAALIVNLPASVLRPALDRIDDFSYAGVKGTVWNGVILDVAIEDADVGAVDFMVSPFALFWGEARIVFAFGGGGGGDVRGAGVASAGLGGSVKLTDVSLEIDLTRTGRRYRLVGAPIVGRAIIEDASVVWSARNGCRAAAGRVWTDLMRGPAGAYGVVPFDLSGPLSCAQGALHIALAGAGEEGRIALDLSIDPRLRYELSAAAAPRRASVDQALQAAGFEKGGDGLVFSATGVFNGV
ncbi:MAG: type II secretion system protein N [Pseudomonadota bacterium]